MFPTENCSQHSELKAVFTVLNNSYFHLCMALYTFYRILYRISVRWVFRLFPFYRWGNPGWHGKILFWVAYESSRGYHNQVLGTGWLTQQKLVSHNSGSWRVKESGCPLPRPPPWLVGGSRFSHCLHMAFPLCMCVLLSSSFNKLFLFPPQFYWDMIDVYHWVSLRSRPIDLMPLNITNDYHNSIT